MRRDYPWAQLLRDYRLCAVQSVYVAVEWLVLEGDRPRMRCAPSSRVFVQFPPECLELPSCAR